MGRGVYRDIAFPLKGKRQKPKFLALPSLIISQC